MLTPSIPSLPWINDVIPFAFCAWCVINASLAYRTVKIAEMKCAFVLCCCRTWWISAAIHLCQYVRVKAHNLRTMSFPAFGFMAAGCDSSACIKLSQSVRGSTWLCRFDGPQDEIWSGDHLWLNAASSAAGRFSQTMTQSLCVAYFGLLLVRSSVKSEGDFESCAGCGLKSFQETGFRCLSSTQLWILLIKLLNALFPVAETEVQVDACSFCF